MSDAGLALISHAARAEAVSATVSGRCPDGEISVTRSLEPGLVRVVVQYGEHQRIYGPTDQFAADLTLAQHTGFWTLACRPRGGVELIVTSIDLRESDAFLYSVTRFDAHGDLDRYSGLLRESRDSVQRFLPAVVGEVQVE